MAFSGSISRRVSVLALLLFVFASARCWAQSGGNEAERNKALVRAAFAKWTAGTGGPFDLLADDIQWTITGESPISGTCTSKKQCMDENMKPLNARLSVHIKPQLIGLYGDGDTVVVLWKGEATARDGKPYNNTYSWIMEMHGGQIKKVVAFFDTVSLTDLWNRIPENPAPAQ